MIRLTDNAKITELLSYCGRYPECAVICTRLKAYGTDTPFYSSWYCESDGVVTGILDSFDGVLTVHADSDFDEIRQFIPFTGCREFFCSEETASMLGLDGKRCFMMRYEGCRREISAERISAEDIRHIFPVIFEDIPEAERKIMFPSWYTDISHKLRHGTVRAYGIRHNGIFVSCAVTSGESESSGIISSVAALGAYRKRGFGSAVTLGIAESLLSDGKTPYLITDCEKTKQWYETLGFAIHSAAVQGKIHFG